MGPTPINPNDKLNLQNYRQNEELFTRVFSNQIVKTVTNQTGFLQMALKKISGVVRFKGNVEKQALNIAGADTVLASDWVNIDDGDNVTIVAVDGILDVTIDASSGSFKLMAIK